jgi:zinc/manganese transport system permease protein
MSMVELMLPPFAACMVLVAMLSYLGIHVIAREVIFVDLSLAQMAALGATSALIFGVAPDSRIGYLFALAFTTIGAFIFALTRTDRSHRRVPQEAFIGIVYVVASAAAILVADKAPKGAEAMENVMVGTILWVTWPTIFKLAGVYALVGLYHWFLRKRFFTISLHEDQALAQGWSIRLWDFLFYLSFGVVITLAVPIAGVLLVFTFLVVPAVVAFLFARGTARLLSISWVSSAIASAIGLAVSFKYDLPTGPLIVCVFGILLLLAVGLRQILGSNAALIAGG